MPVFGAPLTSLTFVFFSVFHCSKILIYKRISINISQLIFKLFNRSNFEYFICPINIWSVVILSVELSAPDRRDRVRGSPDETLPCTLMTPDACKIHRGCNVLKVPIQNYTSEAEMPTFKDSFQ